MMLVTLLCELARRDVRLAEDGDRLRVDAPRGVLTPELRGAFAEHKAALVEWTRVHRHDVIVLDFETRAAVNLEDVGARTYVAHQSFEVLCLVAMGTDQAVTVWTPGQPPPVALLDAASMGVPLVAHNAARFDRLVWEQLGWPPALWIDTITLARMAGLPGQLDMLAFNLLGRRKDIEGQKLTLALGRPNRDGRLPAVTTEILARVAAYLS